MGDNLDAYGIANERVMSDTLLKKWIKENDRLGVAALPESDLIKRYAELGLSRLCTLFEGERIVIRSPFGLCQGPFGL